MRCIAIDDEPITLSVISQICERTGDIDLSVYSDPVEGINRVIETVPDIVFLVNESEFEKSHTVAMTDTGLLLRYRYLFVFLNFNLKESSLKKKKEENFDL